MNRIKIYSPDQPATPNFVPLAEVPIECGYRHLGDLVGLTCHTYRGAKAEPSCHVILLQSVYRKVNDHLREDTKREHGGFLLGFETTLGETNTPAVVIVDSIAAVQTEGSPVRLNFTEDTWRSLTLEMAHRYGAASHPPQQVGWYHSHPNIRIFLSTWDLDVCTTYERRRYPVAMVVDPVNDLGGFFVGGAAGYDPQAPQGLHEAHDLQMSSIVTWGSVLGGAMRELPPAAALDIRNQQRIASTGPIAVPDAVSSITLQQEPTPPRQKVAASAADRSADRAREAAPVTFAAKLPAEPDHRSRQKQFIIRVPSNWTLASSLWPIASGILSLLLLMLTGTLLFLLRKDQRQIASLQVSLAGLQQAPSHSAGASQHIGQSNGQPSGRSSDQVTPPPPGREISLDPVDKTLGNAQKAQFKASMKGFSDARVRWTIDPNVGSITQAGVYTAPLAIKSAVHVLVKAASVSNSDQVAVARIHLDPLQRSRVLVATEPIPGKRITTGLNPNPPGSSAIVPLLRPAQPAAPAASITTPAPAAGMPSATPSNPPLPPSDANSEPPLSDL